MSLNRGDETRSVAIHQPNFFPWLGYFDKLNKSDIFILMDNVQFPKKGGVWTNRVKIAVNGQARWLTMPVVRNYHGYRLIKDMEINNMTPWRTKILRTLGYHYGKCHFFKEEWEFIASLINNNTQNLSVFNTQAIISVTEHLGMDVSKLVHGSALKAEGKSTELLIALTEAVGGTAYICGGGAEGYQEDEKFHEKSIRLLYQNFRHPVYSQCSEKFIRGLSVIDVLFNCGRDAVRELLDISKREWECSSQEE